MLILLELVSYMTIDAPVHNLFLIVSIPHNLRGIVMIKVICTSLGDSHDKKRFAESLFELNIYLYTALQHTSQRSTMHLF